MSNGNAFIAAILLDTAAAHDCYYSANTEHTSA